MRAAYAAADVFMRIIPAMPMLDLPNAREIAPIARLGQNRRAEINTKLGLDDKQKLVLVSMGGIAMRLPMEHWPSVENVRWIVQADWQVTRPDVIALESLNMDFTDVLASSDVLLCKPGYGSFAEAGCNGIPVLYVAREDWPEEPYLIDWLEQVGACCKVSREQSETGEFAAELQSSLAQRKPEPVQSSGIEQAAEYLLTKLTSKA